MIRNRPLRRSITAALLILGALLMLFAPPVWIGAIVLAVAFVLEAIGIAIERGDVS